MKAISVEIFRSAKTDCSNNGISNRFKEVLIPCEDGFIEVDEKNPPENLCKVVLRDLGFCQYVHVEPWEKAKGAGWMYGGTIVDTSDSRFRRVTGIDYPVHLHDRDETWDEHNRYAD